MSSASNDLCDQMKRQRVILDYIGSILDTNVLHLALLPGALASSYQSGGPESVVTWEGVRDAFKRVMPDDSWVEMLTIAIEKYALLAAPRGGGKFCDLKLTGKEILRAYRAGTLNMTMMGRVGGLEGKRLQRDLQEPQGEWRCRTYETNALDGPANRNWFPIAEFARRLQHIEMTGAS